VGNINNINQKDKRFNAVAGLLNDVSKAPLLRPGAPKVTPINYKQPVLIDDYLPSTKAHVRLMPSLKLVTKSNPQPFPPKPPQTVVSRAKKPAMAHQPEPPKTLVRAGLSKPAPKERIKHIQASLSQSKSQLLGAREQLIRHELRHAHDVQRDYRITRFGKKELANHELNFKLQPLSVKLPLYSNGVGIGGATAIDRPLATAKTKQHRQAVSSHYNKHQKLHQLRRHFGLAVFLIIALFILGYFVVQLTPKIDVKVAAIHAGIAAQLPSYHPAGYVFSGPVKYGSGIVNIIFKSKSSGRSYSIVQQASHWNSQILQNNYVATLNESYMTVNSDNLTIYLYGLGQAVWVNKGILYQISGSADLPQSQILNIASSI